MTCTPLSASWLPSFQRLGGGRGCNKFVPVLRGDGTKIAPTGDIFDQPPGGISFNRGKLADHARDYLVLSPEGVVLVTSPGTESSYPRPPQSLRRLLPVNATPSFPFSVSLLSRLYNALAGSRELYPVSLPHSLPFLPPSRL